MSILNKFCLITCISVDKFFKWVQNMSLFYSWWNYSIYVCMLLEKKINEITMLMLQKLHHGRSYLKANQLYWDWCQNWAWVQRQGWICCAFWEFWSRSVVWCFTVPGTWSPSLCFGWCTFHSTKYIHCYHTMIIIKKKL